MHRDEIRALLGEQTPGSLPDETEVGAIQSALSLLKALPEIEPSPETWKKIESKLPGRRSVVFKYWLRTAVAASVMAAALSFAVAIHAPRTGALPVVVETGKALNS